jgi:uncharacterized membrane protein YcaP (DUF421 family)
MTREEVLAALRTNGTADLAQVAAVVLETDGLISILSEGAQAATASTLVGVEGVRSQGGAGDQLRPARHQT